MDKLVVLSLGNGDLYNGFDAVTAQLWEQGIPQPMKFTASLPPAPEMIELYRSWQLIYTALSQRLYFCPRLEIEAADVTNVSEVEFKDLCQQLINKINTWLNSEPFHNIDRQLRTQLNPREEIRFVIETNDKLLWRLPWHLWNFFADYPKAEVGLSASQYKRLNGSKVKISGAKVRILAILGNSKGIELEKDRAFLEKLPEQAETKFLVEPQPQQLNDQLWEHGWDILFFAGHSSSHKTGIIQINPTDSLTLDQLKYALNKAIASGLKLAIFNSCDGLGLAQELAELHIGQVIVMREPVPDVVAQEFLRHFLAAFAGGQSLYVSVRYAKERLQSIELKYPCATWLPVICQNPAEVPITWQQLCGHKRRVNQNPIQTVLVLSAVVTALVIGIRHLGILQPLELQAFDHLQRLRPQEKSDPRLLVVTITEADISAQKHRKGSLSDDTLARLVHKLQQYQPRAIGLDIYRDFPVEPAYQDLATTLRQNQHFIGVCKSRDFEVDPDGVPPPPEIPLERVGFSDFLEDADGVLRRQLLAMTPDPASVCSASYAFSVLLAFHYLAAEGILPKFTTDGNLQLGTVVFKRLKPHTGVYQQVDTRGNQILLNYRSAYSPQRIAPQVTLAQVLHNQINPNAVKGRIVLIGTIATSVKDDWSTPYGAGSSEKMPGVVVQAQMVSQILSAVKQQRPILWFLPAWGDSLWIWGWSLVGGILAYRQKTPIRLLLMGGVALAVLSLLCYSFLLQGGWLPLVPGAFALLVTAASVKKIPAKKPGIKL